MEIRKQNKNEEELLENIFNHNSVLHWISYVNHPVYINIVKMSRENLNIFKLLQLNQKKLIRKYKELIIIYKLNIYLFILFYSIFRVCPKHFDCVYF